MPNRLATFIIGTRLISSRFEFINEAPSARRATAFQLAELKTRYTGRTLTRMVVRVHHAVVSAGENIATWPYNGLCADEVPGGSGRVTDSDTIRGFS